MIDNLFVLLPEISLALLAFFIQMLGVSNKVSNKLACQISLAGLVLVIYIISRYHLGFSLSAFDGRYVENDYSVFCKLLIFIFSFFIIMNYIGYNQSIFREYKPEYVVLILFTAIGSSIAISARDFLILFLGLELQSLTYYVLATFNRDNILSSEAGLKYFVLGALSSCFMLFGISFIYGFTGSISYNTINNIIMISNGNIAITLGMILLFSGLMFKLSIVPFHSWTPDVYEGSPIISLNLFSSAGKISAMSVVIILSSSCIKFMGNLFYEVITILSILSIIVGSIGAIMQSSVKRMMGYSAILNMGYAITPFVLWDDIGFEVALKFVIIYSISCLAFFSILTSCLGEKAENAKIEDLIGLGRTKKAASIVISLLMFSMIGIPPMAGFFGKYYILYQMISSKEYLLAFFVLLGSLISAYYYLNIIKVMYFCDNLVEESSSKLNLYLLTVIVISASFILFYSILPNVPFHYFVVSS